MANEIKINENKSTTTKNIPNNTLLQDKARVIEQNENKSTCKITDSENKSAADEIHDGMGQN